MLASFEAVQKIMLPSLRAERAACYSPFLPIHPRTGVVMQVRDRGVDAAKGLIAWRDPDDRRTVRERGHRRPFASCNGSRTSDALHALGVDYEMAGKAWSVRSSCPAMTCAPWAATPPEGFNYECSSRTRARDFKVEGNGLTIDDGWPTPAPRACRSSCTRKPREAKKLFRRHSARRRRYLAFLDAYPRRTGESGSPIRSRTFTLTRRRSLHCSATARQQGNAISFAMLLNLTAVANGEGPRCSGASCNATRRTSRRRPIRGSTR